jgi:hypothetical protein
VQPSGPLNDLSLLQKAGAVMAHPVKTFPAPSP